MLADTLNDFKWYFFHRRRGTDPTAVPEVLRARLLRCSRAFAGPRFGLLHRRWLTEGDTALTSVSPLVAEAFASGRARLECIVLPHTYDHLSPLVNHRRLRRRRVTADADEGARAFRSLNPPLNPAP